MPNTVTQRTVQGNATSKRVYRLINIVSDGTEETDLVIYDNSAFAANVSKGNVKQVEVSGSFTGAVRLEWDQTTDSPICSFGKGDAPKDFNRMGGIPNPGGTGATGDVVLTTTALALLDEVTILIEIEQT